MENNEEGKISEAIIEEKKEEVKPVEVKQVATVERAVAPISRSSLATALAILALLLGGGGLALGFIALDTAMKPITVISSDTDGNSENFTEG